MSKVYDLLTEIAACLCSQIEADGRPKPCFCGVVPGTSVALDYFQNCFDGEAAQDGMAWARLALTYPANQPGLPINDPAEAAYAGIGHDIEVGIMRGMPLDPDGNTPQELADSTQGQIEDMLTIRTAIQCCVALERGDYVLGAYAPLGPLGGAVGGAWTVSIHRP